MIDEILKSAHDASHVLALSSILQRNHVLEVMADQLIHHQSAVLEANQHDLSEAVSQGVSQPLINRLTLDKESISSLALGLKSVIHLPDPLAIATHIQQPNGLILEHIRVPLGVIGLIYESRPGVTVESTSLALKSGNAILLRGGSEARKTNQVLHHLWQEALSASDLPKALVVLLLDPDHRVAEQLMHLRGLDLLIPRGGQSLIDRVTQTATVPVIATGTGNCHLYVDAHADVEMALRIFQDSKLGNPAVCNSVETLLVHESQATFLAEAHKRLMPYQLIWHGDKSVQSLLSDALPADESDWQNEYLGPQIAARLVPDVNAALAHIERYGTGHSESIVTEHYKTARYFMTHVDAAVVYWNASTRFTDGQEFGLGAEVGISTQKLHARGPMGVASLTTTKTLGIGQGQTRDFFTGQSS